jgi:formate C-acetyltransferase
MTAILLPPPTERVARLRAAVLARDLPAEISPVRATLAQAALDATVAQPQPLRLAAVLERVFHDGPVLIHPDELLVGCRGCDGYPEIDAAVARGSAEHPYLIADFESLLAEGMLGVIARAEARLATLDEANPDEMDGVYFLRAAVRSCRAVIAWAERYAAEAERQAAGADPARRDELLAIAARCRRVPAHPARTFPEAVQAVWFLYVALYLETTAASCLGRLDQYLYPFYRRDLDAGALTRDDAKEWLCCLWAKLFENILGRNGWHAQTITLGGTLPDGSPGMNDLSLLCLEVAATMGNVGAQIAVRWYDGQDPALMRGAVDLAARGAIMPQLFNEESYLAALTDLGVPLDDARRFALFGCHEPTLPGLGYQRPASWPGYVSFYDWVEDALGLRSTGHPPVLEIVADPPADREAFWTRWLDAMRAGVRRAVIAANYGDQIKREWLPRPLMSAFIGDCLATARDLTAGGARYNMTGFQGCALATAVDAFLAVEELVFATGAVEMGALRAALQANFDGFDTVRQRLRARTHSFGADDPVADELAVRMVTAFCDEVARHRNTRGGPFTVGMWSFLQNILMGNRTAASPDGRRAGDPISHSLDPITGRAVHGPTAVVRSVTRLPHRRFANGGSMLLEFSTGTLADPDTRGRVQALCDAYLRLGGIELQLSAATRDRLEAARRDPDAHRDLVVRVAGYSDFFTRLTPDLQDYIIDREKHEV